MMIDNNELKDFIQETLRQVQEGSAGHTVMGEVDFEVAIAKTAMANGKIGVTVLGLDLGTGIGGELKAENISKVKFSVRIKGAWNKIAPTSWPK